MISIRRRRRNAAVIIRTAIAVAIFIIIKTASPINAYKRSFSSQKRNLVACDTLKACYLINLGKLAGILLAGGDRNLAETKLSGDDTLYIDPSNLLGYSVRCDTNKTTETASDLIIFSFNGLNQFEYGEPRHMFGDRLKGSVINPVSYLSKCGIKTFTVELQLLGEICSETMFTINSLNPDGTCAEQPPTELPSLAPPEETKYPTNPITENTTKQPVRPPMRLPTPIAPSLAPSKKPTMPITFPTKLPLTMAPVISPTNRTSTKAPISATPTNSQTRTPATDSPVTSTPTSSPTQTPTKRPSTKAPTTPTTTNGPSKAPVTEIPTSYPTTSPTKSPSTRAPASTIPTNSPSQDRVTEAPTLYPSDYPTKRPSTKTPRTSKPTNNPSLAPATESPTFPPSKSPTDRPSTKAPISSTPTNSPSQAPATEAPTTSKPSSNPSKAPVSDTPTVSLTDNPTTVSTTTHVPTNGSSNAPGTEAPTTSQTDTPTTLFPTTYANTNSPSNAPVTEEPTVSRTDSPITVSPTTYVHSNGPSNAPVTERPISPQTDNPTTVSPTSYVPTNSPSHAAVTVAPTVFQTDNPTTVSPTTYAPTNSPSNAPVTKTPTVSRTGKPTIVSTVCDTLKACYLINIKTREEFLLDNANENTYLLDPNNRRGYSIRCDMNHLNGKESDYIKFIYDNMIHEEFGLPRYMFGDSNAGGYINHVPYLSNCGPKTVTVEGYIWKSMCFREVYVINMVNPNRSNSTSTPMSVSTTKIPTIPTPPVTQTRTPSKSPTQKPTKIISPTKTPLNVVTYTPTKTPLAVPPPFRTPTIPSPVSAVSENTCDTMKACYIVNIETRDEFELVSTLNTYQIKPTSKYSIRCDLYGYPNAANNYVRFRYDGVVKDEYGSLRYMAGDSVGGTYINPVPYLSPCGVKSVVVELRVGSFICFVQEFIINIVHADGSCTVPNQPTSFPVLRPTLAPVRKLTIKPTSMPTVAPVRKQLPTIQPISTSIPTKIPELTTTSLPLSVSTKAPVNENDHSLPPSKSPTTLVPIPTANSSTNTPLGRLPSFSPTKNVPINNKTPSPVPPSPETVCDTLKACYLVDIKSRRETLLHGADVFILNAGNDIGYSIRCDMSNDLGSQTDYISFNYENTIQMEFGVPRYMYGDEDYGTLINPVPYLETCGLKMFTIEIYLRSTICSTQEFYLYIFSADGTCA